ncbi:MAG: PIN domain-containing protein [Burkholderiales bacterium]
MTLVDTNVLIDLLQDDTAWAEWSEAQLFAAQQKGALYINVIGYAELMPAFDSKAELDAFLKIANISVKDISCATAYLAGEAFLRYRKRKGTKSGVLADFFIGAHAQTEGLAILTRYAARYKTYFPQVTLICP